MRDDQVGVTPRAVGVRLTYADIPHRVRAWVDATLGAGVAEAREQRGGMSPGCASRLRTTAGTKAFVKAVGTSLNPGTPGLFRREIDVLSALPPVPYRPGVLGTYDDGDWVALLLEDVDGVYPDLTTPDGADALAVLDLVERQTRELTPPPAGPDLRTVGDIVERALSRWTDVVNDPHRFLPGWAAERVGELHDRVSTLPGRVTAESMCHWDVRDDNLLVRPDGTVVILDWGMASLGPAWSDLFVLAATWADRPAFDDLLRTVADQRTVTDLLLLLGGSQAWRGANPAPPGLPSFPAFCRSEATRMFDGVARRLQVNPTA